MQRATLTPGRDPHAMLQDMVIAVTLKDPKRHQSLYLVHVRHILTKVHFQMRYEPIPAPTRPLDRRWIIGGGDLWKAAASSPPHWVLG